MKEPQDIPVPLEITDYDEAEDFIARWNSGIRSPRYVDAREKQGEKDTGFQVPDDGIRLPKLFANGKLVGKKAKTSNNGVLRFILWVIRNALQLFEDEKDPDEE